MKEITNIDMQNMLADFMEYDPIFDRYYIGKYCRRENGDLKGKFFRGLHYATQIEKYSTRDFRNFDYNGLKQLVKAIYGDSDQSEMIEVISLVQEKFIKGFINIPHLEDLFSEHYFEYEWEMHSKLDPDKKQVNFYRDHYFHQVRNLYEIFKFLESGKDEPSPILKKLLNEMKFSTGNTARYCNHVITEAKKIYFGNSQIYKNLFKNLVGENTALINEYFDEFALSYIVRGALYVAALTHDIGYPIERHIQRNREFVKFISNPAYSRNIFDFDNVRNIIDKSLLFDIVDADKIKSNLSKKKRGMDHGVISAIALLIHFYEHGSIYELDPLKRAIIELAAIINYDHTADYHAIEKDYEPHRENYPRWKKNPLSILFRVVDDIQEWDRVYFEVQPYPNVRICSRCKMPMLKKEIDFDTKNSYIVNEFTKFKHVCGCNGNKENQTYELDYGAYKQLMSFNNQKINYVIASNRVYFIQDDLNTEILIDYNPYKLMELLLLSATDFHEHRIEEIYKLKEFVKLSESNLFKVSAYLHYDPNFLRQKIVYDFLAALYHINFRKNSNNQNIDKFNFIYEFKDHSSIQTLFRFDFEKIIETIENYECELKSLLNMDLLDCFKNNCIFLRYENMELNKESRQVTDIFLNNICDLIFKIIDLEGAYGANCKINIKNILKNLIDPNLGFRDLFDTSFDEIKNDIREKKPQIKDLTNPQNYKNELEEVSNTDEFYSYFYILSIMNDFTEMAKRLLSNNAIANK